MINVTYSNNNEDTMRLQKFIAHSGYCSRRKAEELIEAGRVYVNGERVTEQGLKVSPNAYVVVDGNVLTLAQEYEYYLLNKPRGVFSTSDDEHDRVTVVDGIQTEARIYPVGRLDKETTGALILTNDGEFTHYMTHPSYELDKRYRVSVDGELTYEVINALKDGVKIDGVEYRGVEINAIQYIKKKNITNFNIRLHEGKNRQIRKIFDHYQLPVRKLHRFALGPIFIDDLQIGEYRPLKDFEVKKLILTAKGLI